MNIVTDSAADMPAEELQALGVTVAPLFINFPEGEVESSSLTPDQFYDRLEAMQPDIPTTSQPSGGLFSNLYRSLPPGDTISIHISSGLSGTVNSARLGAKDLTDRVVQIVDTMTLSGGERFQVLAAVRGARAGWSSDKIAEQLAKVRAATEVAFTLETLTYLARGGRIGRVQALAGSLLHIKPIIHVAKADGKYSTAGRARTMPKAVELIAEHMGKLYGASEQMLVTVMHGKMAEQAAELGRLLQSRLKVVKLETLRVSPVLSVHTGPGVVGAAVVPLDVMPQV